MSGKLILSGIQPSGNLTLGNYLGAMQNFVTIQDTYEEHIKNYMIADLHSLTVFQKAKDLRNNVLSTVATYLAVGLSPEKSNIFVQSHAKGHADLAWILSCHTALGQLTRMTQFKDKQNKGIQVNAGLYNYPILMAADILLYNATHVPVGNDQKQHLELTRDLAIRFNNTYSETFNIPEPIISKLGARIMDLSNPCNKMSKSASSNKGVIFLSDDLNIIKKKIMSAVTDSDNEIKYINAPHKAGMNNLLTIYSVLTGKTLQNIEEEYQGLGYGIFKKQLAEIVVESIRPIQDSMNKYLENKDYLLDVLRRGKETAEEISFKVLRKIYKKIGVLPLK